MNKLQRLIKTVVMVLAIVIGQQTYAVSTSSAQKSMSDAEYQTQILYYINQYRMKHHLAPLKMIKVISQEATKHSRNMATRALPFGHNNFDHRIKKLYSEIKECRGGAENVAYYKLDAKKLVEQWIASPGHRRNIEGNYNLTGIGIAHGKKGWAYYTQIFLRSDATKKG